MDDALERTIREITFRDDVPDDVMQRFDDIKHVLATARAHERLIRVAVEYTYTTHELAIKSLWERLGEKKRVGESDSKLSDGLKWLHANDYWPHLAQEEPEDWPSSEEKKENLDERRPAYVGSLPKVRNRMVHPKNSSWIGLHGLKLIKNVVGAINALYNRPNLRVRQRKERRAINKYRRLLESCGCVVETEKGRMLFHEANMLYCGFEEEEPIYYFAFWPLFELDVSPGDVLTDRQPYMAKCTAYECDRGSLKLKTEQGNHVWIRRKMNEDERREVGEWIARGGRAEAFMLLHHPGTLRAALIGMDNRLPLNLDKDVQWIE